MEMFLPVEEIPGLQDLAQPGDEESLHEEEDDD